MENDLIDIENENLKKEKVPKTKFGRFWKKNKINFIFIIIGLFVILSVVFTAIGNKTNKPSDTTLNESVPMEIHRSAYVGSQDYEVTILYPITSFSGNSTYLVNEYYVLANIEFSNETTNQLIFYSENNQIHIGLSDGAQEKTSFGTYSYNNYTYSYVRSWYARLIIYGNIVWNDNILSGVSVNGSTFFQLTAPSNVDFDNFFIMQNDILGSGYELGYHTGIEVGKDEMLELIDEDPAYYGYVKDYVATYNEGVARSEGVEEGLARANDFSLSTLLLTIFQAPSSLLDMFNFQVFGINIKYLVTFFITIGVVIFVIRIFKKG